MRSFGLNLHGSPKLEHEPGDSPHHRGNRFEPQSTAHLTGLNLQDIDTHSL